MTGTDHTPPDTKRYLREIIEHYDYLLNLDQTNSLVETFKSFIQEEKYKFEITGLNANIDLLKAENASIIEQTDARIEMLEKELNKKTRNDRPWILAAGFAIGTGVTIGIVKALESSP